MIKLGRTAAVLTEGVLTNCGTVQAEAGFLAGLRAACTEHGTVLIMDETHTQFDLYGGAVTEYGVAPDLVTGGKSIGMTGELAGVVESHLENDAAGVPGIALDGTLFGNALSLRCAEVVLTELMTPTDHERIAMLGTLLADGIEAAAREHELDWRANRFGARTGYCLGPELPKTAHEGTPAWTRCSPTPAACSSPTAACEARSQRPGYIQDSPTIAPMSTTTCPSSTTSSTSCAHRDEAVGRGHLTGRSDALVAHRRTGAVMGRPASHG